MSILYLIVSILFNAAANGFFKQASTFPSIGRDKLTMMGIGLFLGLLNTICYLKSIETIKLATAYAVFSAGSIILITFLSYLFFRESISTQKAIGLVTLCAGILLLWRS